MIGENFYGARVGDGRGWGGGCGNVHGDGWGDGDGYGYVHGDGWGDGVGYNWGDAHGDGVAIIEVDPDVF